MFCTRYSVRNEYIGDCSTNDYLLYFILFITNTVGNLTFAVEMAGSDTRNDRNDIFDSQNPNINYGISNKLNFQTIFKIYVIICRYYVNKTSLNLSIKFNNNR